MSERIPQAVAIRVPLKLYLSSDHVSSATGKSVAVTISKNGAAFGNPSGGATNATEIGNGWYYVDLSTTDTGTLGPLIVRGTASSCDDSEVAYNVANAHNGGFDALPGTACTTNGSLLTAGTGTAQLTTSSGQVTVGTNNDKSGYTASTVSDKTGYSLTSGERNSIADNILIRDWTSTTAAVGQPARRSLMSGVRKLVNHMDTTSVSGYLVVMREDDVTEAYREPIIVDATGFITSIN